MPYFRIIKDTRKFEWDEECQNTFEQLKKYLMTPPLLASP